LDYSAEEVSLSPKKNAPPSGAAKKAAKKAAGSPTSKTAKKTAAAATPRKEKSGGFTAEERAAMQERARELKAESRGGAKADGEADVLAKIAEMKGSDKAMATRLHALIKGATPSLSPRTWYGMPAYAKDGKVVCCFQNAGKFKARYATLGFSDLAKLDDGAMWPTSFALKALGAAEEKRIVSLVKKAVG